MRVGFPDRVYPKAIRPQKEYLKGKNISYSEKYVDSDEAAEKEMMDLSNGFLGVPFTLIIKDDGTKETVMGFDKGKLDGIFTT